MPAFLAALPAWFAANAGTIGAVSGLAGAGISAGEAIHSGLHSGDAQAAQQAALLKQQQQAAAQADLQKRESILANRAQGQEQTGGALTDTGFDQFVAQLAGYPGGGGSPQAAKATPTGGAGGGAPDISTILATLQGGGGGQPNISGGSSPAQPNAPQAWFELANPVV